MRNKSRSTCSKSLVRNAEIPVAPALTSVSSKIDIDKSLPVREKSDQSDQNQRVDNVSLSKPALNTALRIVKEMKQTSEMKPLRVHNLPDFSEKVTQKINIPYNEHLYHDLVALSVSDIPLAENMCNVKIKPHKQDRSPDLADFMGPHCVSDILHVVTHNFAHHTHANAWDGRKVYLTTEKVTNDFYD